MNPKRLSLYKLALVLGFLLGGSFYSPAQEVAPFTARLDSGNIKIRGDILFVGNNILNRATETNPAEANTPYNGGDNNNGLWMEYIDIDSDPSTFSSSSAELNIADPACSQVRYAGLYWAATYPNERSTDKDAPFTGTKRVEDWFNIKFQVPGGSYVDLTADDAADPAGQEDDIIYDGYDPVNINNSFKDSPYVCYKNVTGLVRGTTDPNGEYTVANVRATRGKRNGGSSAGWVLVIIYENPNESGKFISTFDGYAGISGFTGDVDVAVNGFRTLPTPFPVRTRIGVGALEGDRGIKNDRFRIKANSTSNGFTQLTTNQNPGNNFFNSTITTNGNQVPTRTPYGTNTLGTDLDLFNLNNPSNSVLPNGESGATLQFTSSGDGYGPFLATFAVEIIEPNIVLEKRVEDIAGNDITDGGVNLGQSLDYVLSFRNLGNDHAKNYTIRDVLPVNTSYVSFDVSGAPGVTTSYDAVTNEIDFFIPDNLVEIGNPVSTIRLRVEVASNCFDFVDACSDQIQNSAYSTYRGDINTATITDDPSASDFDNCGFVTPGATNFLLDDLSGCNFTRTVQLCGANAILDAGDGFDSYVWVRDDNNNGQVDGSDTVVNDGNPDNDPSTLLVDDIGTYIVDKIIADPCKGFKEIIAVERFGDTQTNPIIDYFNDLNSDANPTNDIQGEIVTCSVDGDLLPKIFLCGANDSQQMQINITDAQSLSWEKLDEGSCDAAGDDCANKNLGCRWDQVGSGNNYTADTAGKYRLVINYTNGCFSRFYFDVFQNNLDIQYNKKDIICARDGHILITNLGSNYGYQLVDHANSSILVPFSAGQGPTFDFGSGENGSYRVEVVQLDAAGDPIPGACIFSTDPVGIRDRDFQVDITTTPANCNAQGKIKIDVLNVRPDYTYVLRWSNGTLIDDETTQPDNTHTFTVNPGDYTVETSTVDGCTDSQDISVGRIPNPTLSALKTTDIGCTAGTIELTRTGGQGNPDFLYAIWSKDGTIVHHPGGSPTEQEIVNNIPADAYQVNSTFNFGWRDDNGDGTDEYIRSEDGTYEFVIIDANNCYAFSNPVTISDKGVMDFSAANTPIVCSGSSTANLTITATGGVGPYSYSIDDGATYEDTDIFVNLSAGSYGLRVTDASGCDVQKIYTITEPFTLSASAGVTEVVECNPSNGAEVRITNAQGGTAPYEYSFDGGSNYGSTTIAFLPSGTHDLTIKDASGCVYRMTVTVPPPVKEPDFDHDVVYECDGEGTITVTSDNSTDFEYTYELNGTLNTPNADDNTFENVTVGTHKVTINYTANIAPAASDLLKEDFGVGPNTSIDEIDPAYCYEPQNGAPSCPGFRTDTHIQDGEYSVTQSIVNPYGPWRSPNDKTGNANGRFLAINVGGTAGVGGIVYAKKNIEVLPDRVITVSLEAFNLLVVGTIGGGDPSIEVQLVNGSGTVIQSVTTGNIPRNKNEDDWINYTVDLNPGSENNLDIVIRTNSAMNSGNDIAIDDIRAIQTPLVCSSSKDITVIVEPGKAFEAQFISVTNVSCNEATDGAITFEVENFDAGTGFDYSVDNKTNWITSTSSPVTTAAVFDAGSHRIFVRRNNEPTCEVFFDHTITEPNALVASASVTTPLTCTNGGATITASATGGTAVYQYQLETSTGATVRPYQTNATFLNVPANATGESYIVRVQDAHLCTDEFDTPITITDPEAPEIDVTSTVCYSGNNDGSITVAIRPTSLPGNPNFEFALNGNYVDTGTTSHTFSNLSQGTYTIDVRDAYGCMAAQETVAIHPALTATVDVEDISCNDGKIAVNATGGQGALQYAFVPATTTVTAADFGVSNVYTVTAGNDGDYEVYVWDNNATDPHCAYTETVTVDPATPLVFTATPTDPQCHDGKGSIGVAVTSGKGPYTIQIVDVDNGGASNDTSNNVVTTAKTYYNLAPGDYEITVTDANGCALPTVTETITNPFEMTADIDAILPADCSGNLNDYGFRFNNYPTTLGTLEFSSDDGATWQSSDSFTGAAYQSGTEVYPSIRTVDGSGDELCRTDFPRYTIPYPLDGLNIALTARIVDCGNLEVTVQGTEGLPNYEYTYSEDPANFNPAAPVIPWTTPTPGDHVYAGLVPGRTYVFYVRDSSPCLRQSSINVNDVAPPPIKIDGEVKPTCQGATNGTITYTITENDPGDLGGTFDWDLYEITDPTTPIHSGTVSGFTSGNSFTVPEIPPSTGLGAGEYFVEIRGAASNNCVIGSENLLLKELDPITGTPNVLRNIACADRGLIEIRNIKGGGGTYTYTLSSPNFTADIVSTDNPVEVPLSNLVNATSTPTTVTINVTDQYGCSNPFGNLDIDVSQSPAIDSIVVDNCASPFSITVNASGGAAPYRYSLDGGASYPNTSGIYKNVAIGSYNISILDSNGCTAMDTAEIYPVLEASAEQTKLIDCTPTPNGAITIKATNGSGDYDYEIDGPGTVDQARTALTANEVTWNSITDSDVGIYTVKVYDNNRPSCPPRNFTIDVPARLEPQLLSISGTNESCNTADNGSITINMGNNGIGPFDFAIVAASSGTPTLPIVPSSSTGMTATFDNLEGAVTPGITYTVRATSIPNGCSTDFTQVVEENDPVVVTAPTPVQYACTTANNSNNSSITVTTVSGGTNNFVRYQFFRGGNATPVQNSTDPTYIETDFAGGSYDIFVFDDQGCSNAIATKVVIDRFDELKTLTPVLTAPTTCAGEDIRLDAVSAVTNSTANPANYEFREVPSGTFGPSNLFTELSVGVHKFQVRNIATGCVISVDHTVQEPNTFNIVIDKNDVLCHGDNGQITLELTDATYVGPFTYEIFNTQGTVDIADDASVLGPNTCPTNGPTSAIPLSAGNYRVRLTQDNAPACFKDRVFTITTPDAPVTATTSEEANVTCSNDQGKIVVDPTGGVGPYTISLGNNTIPGQPPYVVNNVEAHIFEGLAAGNFHVTITDANGCVFSDTIDLIRPDDIVAIITYTPLACFDGNTASVTASVDPRNVTPVYEYQLNLFGNSPTSTPQKSAFQYSDIFLGLSSGYYSITIRDNVGCEEDTATLEINNPTEVAPLLVRTSPLTCTTGVEFELSATGGSGTFEYSTDNVTWDPMTGNSVNLPLTGMFAAGVYQYYVRDAVNGCKSVLSNSIEEDIIETLTLTVDKSAAFINCNGDNTAIIYAGAEGGLGNYRYSLFTDAALTNNYYATGHNRPDGEFDNLPAGMYYVNVTSDDCTTPAQEVEIREPDPLSVVNADDFTNASCNGADDGTITVELTGGVGPYQYAISPNLNRFDDENTFEDLARGNYRVIAQDRNGCFVELEYSIIEPDVLEVSATALPEVCESEENGSIELSINGGTAPYSTRLSDETNFVQDRTILSDLASGDYIVFIRDALGCDENVVITVDPGVNLNATVEPVYGCNGNIPSNYINIVLDDASISDEVLYALDSTDPADMQLNPYFRDIAPGSHYIAISHANGCIVIHDFKIENYEPLTISVEQININELTANVTGGKEAYTIYFGDDNNGSDNTYRVNRTDTYVVTVVDENGCEASADIFIEFIDIEIPNFFSPNGDVENQYWKPRKDEGFPQILTIIFDRYGREVYRIRVGDRGWNGFYQQTELPTGDYWYVIKLNGENDDREFVGHFTLYR